VSLEEKNPSTKSPIIKIKINGIWIKALVDTGSAITIINENKLQKLQHGRIYGNVSRNYRTANNGELKTKGLVDLKMTMNQIATTITAEISKMVCMDLILGQDWCYNNNAIINFQERTIKVNLRTWQDEQQIVIPLDIDQQPTCLVRTIEKKNENINQCRTCYEHFESKNRLIDHLTKEDHGTKSPLNDIQEIVFNKLEHLTDPVQQRQTQFMINKHQNLFDLTKPSMIKTSIHHTIQTDNHFPIYHHPRRTSNKIREIIQAETKKMLAEGVVRPSMSSWSSPVVIVTKKDGSPRFCVDYRKINSITRKDVYPLPRIDDIIEQLSGSSWFTKFDLKNGYHQLPISEQDKMKTAFATQDGLFEFNRLPQGLLNSPPTFQRVVNETLGNLRWQMCLAYLDDIVIYSKTFDQHIKDVDMVCSTLGQADFKLNVDKCELFQREITFLGYKINDQGLLPSDEHVQAMKNFPLPTSSKHAYSFVQTANFFRKFIRNFSTIAAPLTKFNRKEVAFKWTEEEQHSFDTLRNHLISSPVLHLPDRTSQFKLQTDASDTGIGGVLLQMTENGYKPVGYASKSLTKSEKKYSTIEKEAMAVWWCITKKFNTYLQGQTFIVETDHQPLSWLNKQPYNNARVDRWGVALQEYDYKIKYIQGMKNRVADCLSRYPLEEIPDQEENDLVLPQACVSAVTRSMTKTGSSSTSTVDKQQSNADTNGQTDGMNINNTQQQQNGSIDMEVSSQITTGHNKNEEIFFNDDVLRKHQQLDEEVQNILRNMENQTNFIIKHDGILYKRKTRTNGRMYELRYVPHSLRKNVLNIYHDSTFNGSHFGIKRTFYKIRDRYFWPNQFNDIKKHILLCVNCKKNNHIRRKSDGHLQPIIAPQGIMERVAMDFVGKLPTSTGGNQYVIVLTDLLSKFVIIKPVRDCSSTTAVKFLVEDVMLKFGIPKEIITDNGTHFISSLFSSLTKMMGCCHIKISPYHAQANGQCERFNGTFLPKVLALTNEEKTNWDDKLLPVAFSYNNTQHAVTKFTPFELMFGRECRVPADPINDIHEPMTSVYAIEMKKYINFAKIIARKNIEKNQQEMKLRYDTNRQNPVYKVGDKVLVFNQHPTNKLAPKYIGPYSVVKRLGNKTYQVQFDSTSPIHNVTVDKMQLY
jgi:putative transposase